MNEGKKSIRSKKRLHSRLFYSVVIASLSFVIILTIYNLTVIEDREWTAIILDQLTIKKELVNSNFNSTCASILESSGYNLHYHPSEDATISFFKDLPSKSGKVIIIRAHSAVRDNTDWVDLFTSENFREGKYIDLISISQQISKAKMYSFDDDYFAIGPTFVNSSMKGQFEDGSLIILMGCNSLNYTSMAKALVGRGARVVVGWTSWVDANYTDSYTIQLLQHLLAKNPYTIRGSINKLNKEMNTSQSNPYNTRLAYYPTSDEVANYILPRKNEPENLAMLSPGLLIHAVLCQTLVTKRYRDDRLVYARAR